MPATITIEGLTVATELPRGAEPTRPPLLFVHGYLATNMVWKRFLEFFALLGYPCYAMNLRGRRGSRPTHDLGRVRMRDFITDATDVVRAIGKPVVVGHSMGGLIAQKLAEDDAVSAAVLISPAPPRGIPLFAAPLARRMIPYLPAIIASRAVQARFEDFRELVLNCVPVQDQRKMFEEFVPDSGRAARDILLGAVGVDARRVRCPTLVIGCSEDRFVPHRVSERVARKYGANFMTAAGHGHASIDEPRWEQLADSVARWLGLNAESLPVAQRVIA